MRIYLKRAAQRLAALGGFTIFSLNRHGLNLFTDLKRSGVEFNLVFDVGANKGQSTAEFLRAFPRATVYCFEPVSENFSVLQSVCGTKRVVTECIALSNFIGATEINLHQNSGHHSLVHQGTSGQSEPVEANTIDAYCDQRKIDRINFLKIDTEGADLMVLQGAVEKLKSNKIDFLLVETCFRKDRAHVDFRSFMDFLEGYGYVFYGLYEQMREWNGTAGIQYANACFARSGLVLK